MREALYRKHRPKALTDVVGQPFITTTLTNAIKNNRISHGYLFAGPRGVGKTSVARILAHQVNNFEYGDSRGALDIIEIDAASNRRIDEIRNLRDKVHVAPVIGNYKVYIIDEVHMLTNEAFNALLKTLEEPPAHVIFILATTEAHKLPETIISRTQRFIFKAVPYDQIVSHLQNLATQENIVISKDALELIAKHGEGSFRDSISLLDQLNSSGEIKVEDVRRLLGLPQIEIINSILNDINKNRIKDVISQLDEVYSQGIDAVQIAQALINEIRIQANQKNLSTIKLAKQLLTTKTSSNPELYLELTLAEHILENLEPDNSLTHKTSTTQPYNTQPNTITDNNKNKDTLKSELNEPEKPIQKEVKTRAKNTKPVTANLEIDLEKLLSEGLWENLLNSLKSKHNTLYGVTRMASPSIKNNTLILSVPYVFHKKRLGEEKNAIIIRNLLAEMSGAPINIKIEIIDNSGQQTEEPDQHNKILDSLQDVKTIFGGGEVMES